MSENAKAIPKAELQRACRRLCRAVAGAMTEALREGDCTFEQIDSKLGRKPGWARSLFMQLADGKSVELDAISDFLFAAAGATLRFHFEPIVRDVPVDDTPPPAALST